MLETIHHVKEHGGDLKIKGQEKNLTTEAIARMNLFLHGMEDFDIVRGDTLRHPKFIKADKLETFDNVIANPPFSLSEWGYELWQNDPYGRKQFGLAPQTNGDFAWVQHMFASLNDNGRMAVVLPHGVLFRGGAEGRIRKQLLEENRIVLKPLLALPPIYSTAPVFRPAFRYSENNVRLNIKAMC